jgi:hypothetical protein
MTKVGALELALKGKRVRHMAWPKDEYIYYDFEDGKFKEEDGYVCDINYFDSYDLDSWEEYKKTVTKYYWNVLFDGNDRPIVYGHRYENEKELLKNLSPRSIEWVKRIDNTAKEFYSD